MTIYKQTLNYMSLTQEMALSFLRTILAAGLTISASAAAAQTTGPNDGRLLASNCMQCHATNGQPRPGFSSLAGKSASEITGEMLEMARMTPGKEPEKDLMAVHARAYTRAEIDLIAKYLASK